MTDSSIVSSMVSYVTIPLDPHSFKDPTLLNSLTIFSDKTPMSPLVIPMASIRHENVTIRKTHKSKLTRLSWDIRYPRSRVIMFPSL